MTDEATRLAAHRSANKLAKAIDQAGTRRPSVGFQLPVLDQAPPDDSPTNMWALTDGRLQFRLDNGTVYQVSTAVATLTTSMAPVGSDPDVHRYEEHARAYDPAGEDVPDARLVDIRCWCPTHGVEAGGYYGYTPGHGNRKIMITTDLSFDYDPDDAVIRSVRLKFRNMSTYTGGPVQIHWGLHNDSNTNTTANGYSESRQDVFVDEWPAQGYGGDDDGEHDAPTYMATALLLGPDGYEAQGFTIHQPDDDLALTGELDPSTLELIIEYTR